MNIKKLLNKPIVKPALGLIASLYILFIPMTASALSVQVTDFGTASGQAACSALSAIDATQGCGKGNGNSTVNGLITTIINIMSIIVGVIAVIMIIVSGMKFITSGGDTQKVASAKNGLIYALIGLVIVSLAQIIVQFTLGQAATATAPPPTTKTKSAK